MQKCAISDRDLSLKITLKNDKMQPCYDFLKSEIQWDSLNVKPKKT